MFMRENVNEDSPISHLNTTLRSHDVFGSSAKNQSTW